MHLRFNFDACPMHSPFGFLHLTHQKFSARALFCLNSLAKVNTQLLIYNYCAISQNLFRPPVSNMLMYLCSPTLSQISLEKIFGNVFVCLFLILFCFIFAFVFCFCFLFCFCFCFCLFCLVLFSFLLFFCFFFFSFVFFFSNFGLVTILAKQKLRFFVRHFETERFCFLFVLLGFCLFCFVCLFVFCLFYVVFVNVFCLFVCFVLFLFLVLFLLPIYGLLVLYRYFVSFVPKI